ncbi:LPS assembly lipoprotein LptE [Candidatus Parabeggiatoa sp. HSG14]|uniref:LPS-assembly lipoprotein LptE n=1 Tax=Candidatus Parabeggiatoa sp. HSG14 TaxID=3055593 RepID=UPI0025A6D7C6|nr:LPS assembly lipoprotein LptE [Thiotrichales bacterium HSG14]
MKSFFIFCLSFFILFLAGCSGYHLRGSTGYDFSVMHIQSESADKIANEIKRLITEEGVQVVSTPSAAQIVLYLRNESADQRVLTVSSMSGKLAEVELNFRVEMEVRTPNDTVLLEKQFISLLRDHSFDESAVLAMWAEEEMMREDLLRDIVARILRRLQSLKLGKTEVTQLTFEGLKPKYAIGDQFTVDLVETSKRMSPIDIWLTLSIGDALWFVTPSGTKTKPWQLNKEPQPWQRNVAANQTHHRVLDFTVLPNIIGEYALRAVYTSAGAGLDLSNLAATVRSNMAEGSTVFEEQ